MSQDVFARVLNVSTQERPKLGRGRSADPSQAALRLIQVLRQNTSGVLEAIGMPAGRSDASPRKRSPRAGSKQRHAARSGDLTGWERLPRRRGGPDVETGASGPERRRVPAYNRRRVDDEVRLSHQIAGPAPER